MISVDTSTVVSELDKYILEIERRLKRMVEGFAYEVALTASQKTPIGDPDNGNQKYLNWYKRRNDKWGIPIEPGYHKGAWQYSSDGNFVFKPDSTGESSGLDAANFTEQKAIAEYQLGEKFYIGAVGPGYADLENNTSLQTNGQGIIKPTMDSIAISYKVDLKRYFDQG